MLKNLMLMNCLLAVSSCVTLNKDTRSEYERDLEAAQALQKTNDEEPQWNYQVRFEPGKWNPRDWTEVKSARWDYVGKWIQRENWIENELPEGAGKEECQGARASETYSSMLWNQIVQGNFTVSATMDFNYRMAPVIVLAAALGKSKNGFPEYREHWEVILYDQGLNIWHHQYNNGPYWHLAAQFKDDLKADTPYEMSVQVKRTKYGAMITVFLNGQEVSYMEHDFPENLYVGITGCEGLNRFYDFKVKLDQ